MEAKRRNKERRRTRLAALILQHKKDIIVYLWPMLMIVDCVYIYISLYETDMVVVVVV